MEREQVRPLAPAWERPSSDDLETVSNTQNKEFRRKRCLRCGACLAALLLILATLILVLIFTVFRVKEPIIRLNGMAVDKLELANGMPKPGSNLTLTADVSVKNPNFASFRYSNTSSSLSYRGTVVGEARAPPGKTKARRTSRMNITVDIVTDRILSQPSLIVDISTGLLTMDSYTRVGGRMKFLKLISRYVVVKMNCTITVNITTRSIQTQKCKRKVKL